MGVFPDSIGGVWPVGFSDQEYTFHLGQRGNVGDGNRSVDVPGALVVLVAVVISFQLSENGTSVVAVLEFDQHHVLGWLFAWGRTALLLVPCLLVLFDDILQLSSDFGLCSRQR